VKINGSNSVKPVSPTGVQDVVSGKAPGPGPVSPSPARDKVEVSSLSTQLAQVEKALSDIGVVDVARVEAVKQAISEGRFKIDSEVVADKLIATVREYLVNQQS
jgi:negative regulator of flagellin synthesis FlgM